MKLLRSIFLPTPSTAPGAPPSGFDVVKSLFSALVSSGALYLVFSALSTWSAAIPDPQTAAALGWAFHMIAALIYQYEHGPAPAPAPAPKDPAAA